MNKKLTFYLAFYSGRFKFQEKNKVSKKKTNNCVRGSDIGILN